QEVAAEVGAPGDLDRILAAALAPAPEERPSAEALARELEALPGANDRARDAVFLVGLALGLVALIARGLTVVGLGAGKTSPAPSASFPAPDASAPATSASLATSPRAKRELDADVERRLMAGDA